MFVALALTLAVGAAIAGLTVAVPALAIADDARMALLMCVSGAICGWALVDTVTGLSTDGLDLWDAVGAVLGASAISATAWRGRRHADQLAR